MAFESDDAFTKTLAIDLAPRLERAAESMADAVRENIDVGSRSGRKYAYLPRRSSTPSEFPQRQHGDLYNDVGVDGEGIERRVGFIKGKNSQGKLSALEFGYEPNNMAPRKPLARTMETRDVLRAALAAMKDGE